MHCIPLIFTRPFQSIHLSLGHVARTFLYASLYPFGYCAALIIVTLNKAKWSLFFHRSSATDRRVFCWRPHVPPREGYLRVFPPRTTMRSFLSGPLSLWASWSEKQEIAVYFLYFFFFFFFQEWMFRKRGHELINQRAWQQFQFQGRWAPAERDRW